MDTVTSFVIGKKDRYTELTGTTYAGWPVYKCNLENLYLYKHEDEDAWIAGSCERDFDTQNIAPKWRSVGDPRVNGTQWQIYKDGAWSDYGYFNTKSSFIRPQQGPANSGAAEPPQRMCELCQGQRPADARFCMYCLKTCQRCEGQSPSEAQFCIHCGDSFAAKRCDTFADALQHYQVHEDIDAFLTYINKQVSVQSLTDAVPGKMSQAEAKPIERVDLRQVWGLQASCGCKFRDGRPLEDLLKSLADNTVNPDQEDFLILNALAATMPGGERRYFSLDHRRLTCLYIAGCSHVRLRILQDGPAFEEFLRKADHFAALFNNLTGKAPIPIEGEGRSISRHQSSC